MVSTIDYHGLGVVTSDEEMRLSKSVCTWVRMGRTSQETREKFEGGIYLELGVMNIG